MKIDFDILPKHGDIRKRRIFLWFPRLLGKSDGNKRSLRWLESVDVIEQFYVGLIGWKIIDWAPAY